MVAAGLSHLERANLDAVVHDDVFSPNLRLLPSLISLETAPICCAPSAPPPNPYLFIHETRCWVHSVLTSRNEPGRHIGASVTSCAKGNVESSRCRLCWVSRASPRCGDPSSTPPTNAPYTKYRRCMGVAGFPHLKRAQQPYWEA